jgi:predicted transcriptional regulator
MGNRGYQHPVRRSPGYHSKPEVERLKKQVAILSARVAELERETEAARDMKSDNIIVLRDITREQARKEILEAFAADEPLDHADLAEGLRLEISLVFEACNELIDEGLVVFHADNRD